MKKVFRVLSILVLALVIVMAVLAIYVKTRLPDVGEAPDLKVELKAERIEHGRYLANAIAICMDCHSTRDWSKFSGPIQPGTEGQGGEVFDRTMGLPGVYYSKNITPSGIQRYTDGELYRVITTGVTKEGRAIFPIMPYPYYSKMDDEDIHAIIAYLRTLEPIDNVVPESTSDFPMSLILNTIPQKNSPSKRPDKTDELAYGAYLTNAAACAECHSPVKQGEIIQSLAFSGGREFQLPDGSIIRTPNITPHKETGIGKWSKAEFIGRFKAYADSAYIPPLVNAGEYNTIMPWMMYCQMTIEDLGAIYTYLKTIKPIESNVEIFTAAKQNVRTSMYRP